MRATWKTLWALLAFMSATSAGLAAQQRRRPAVRFPAELDRYIANALEQWRVPGMAIAIVRNDSTLVAKGYGVHGLARAERVDENTVFDISQLTNSFIATAAGILVDRGALRWDDPARRYLPSLTLPTDSLTRQATVRDFLTHRSGMESPEAKATWMLTGMKGEEVRRRLRYLRVLAPFRQRMLYSNLGYMVAGDAAAAAAGMPFDAVFRDLLVKPMALRSTTLESQPIAPADAVHSSAADLARWMRLHLGSGVLDGTRYVSDSVMEAMHAVQVRVPTGPASRAARLMQDTVSGYGMGWRIADYRGHRLLWHAGNGNGQFVSIALFPDDKLGIVVLIDTGSALELPGAIVNRIADTYLGYEPRDWAGEAFERTPNRDSVESSNQRAMAAMRASAPPRLPLSAYAGRYEHPLFGPVFIRVSGSALSLQMGDGQLADLEYHGNDAFYVKWRDPFFRENSSTHLAFTTNGDSIAAFSTIMNRDQFMARRTDAPGAPVASVPRSDLNGVEALLGGSIAARWNLRLLGMTGPYDVSSSWLEMERSGFEALVGRYVGLIGGARPIGRIYWSRAEGVARFNIPTEWEVIPSTWEVATRDLRFEVRPAGDSIVGTLVNPAGVMRAFVGTRAPALLHDAPKAWTAPVALFNGKDLSGWTIAPTARSLPNFWTVRDGVLVNTQDEGANLMTVQRFQDFKLHAEFRLPGPGTSGVFPRGRYWVMLRETQNTDPAGKATTGEVHKFLVPSENAGLGPQVWQSIDITMVGRRITVVVNGRTVIADQILPGITGSAIDADEAAPGPIMLQGEETRVEFRNITISVPRAASP